MTIAILGMGHVGLVTAACLAALGHTVVGVDADVGRIAALRNGTLPFMETGLNELAHEQAANGRLSYEHEPAALRGADVALVAVGTLDRSGEWTAEYVEQAIAQVARDRDAPRAIVIRSTLMPGTAARLARDARAVDPAIDIAVNPEFTRQGSAVADFMRPDRVVVGATGGRDGAAVAALRRVYAPVDLPLMVTDSTSAEMIKVGSNAFLSLKIGFANEIARLSAATGADVAEVVAGIGLDRRIGRAFLSPSPGYGGSCLPSQARALPRLAGAEGVETPILASVDESNRHQADWVVEIVAEALEGLDGLDGAQVAILGLTFKAGTDDVRDSPALTVARELAMRGARLVVTDPAATSTAVEELAKAGIAARGVEDVLEAARDATAIVVATEWPEYRVIDWAAVAGQMRGDLVVDARGIVDRAAARTAGLRVFVHGRHAEAPID